MVDFTKSIRINLNLNQNELQDVVIQSLAAAPVAKKVGYIYFNSGLKKFGVCVDATAGAQKWEYMASTEDLETKLAEINAALAKLKTDLTVSKVENATGIQQGDTKIYFDGLVTSVEAAEVNAEGTKGHFLKLTKTGDAETPTEVSYIDMPETVTGGSLDNNSKKIVLTYSDDSTKDIDLAAIYDAIASKTVGIADTQTVDLVSATDPNTQAQTLSANVKLSGRTNNAIKTVDGEDGLLVEKVEDLAAAEGAALGNLATGTAVVGALSNGKFAAATDKYGVIKLATSDQAVAGEDATCAVTPKALHDAIKKNIQGGVTYVGVLPAESAFTGAEKGDLFLVNSNVTFAETELQNGDYVLFHTDAADVTSAKGAFDVINSELSEDVVRLGATQTLTNKTIDADHNTISNLKMTNLAAGNASFATTETTDELKAAAKIASEAKVQEMVNAGVKAVAVDDVTIKNADGKLSVKEGGLEVKHMKADAVAGTIADADTAVNTKLATEKAVRDLHNGIPAETMVLTNKTFDANGTGNKLSNVKVADFAASAIVKAKNGETGGIAADVDAAADDKLATEKAIAEALAAIKASATVVKSVPLTFEMESVADPAVAESATATVALSSLGVDDSHQVSMAKMLDADNNEVEGLISYNQGVQGTRSVVFQINCTTAPTGWKALIIC